MNTLHFSENLIHLRKERKITQEELAIFVGVTKAAVSKWENGQSLPDILLVPQLAAFFDVSVDELLGYESQLSKEQIRACYQRLAADFTKRPFEEVMAESQRLVKKYYSCYPFLNQICVLWLNHFMLPEDSRRQKEVLEEIEKLCGHILDKSKDIALATRVMEIKLMAALQLGKATEVIEELEEICIAGTYEQREALLIQAYLMQGDAKKADKTLQVGLYRNMMQMLNNQILLLAVHAGDLPRCEEIIKRTDEMITTFQLDNLNPNLIANYQYQAALVWLGFQQEEEAFFRIERYIQAIETLFNRGITLTGDEYFNCLDEWFEELELGGERVRDEKLVAESALSIFSHPAMETIKDKKRLEKMKRKTAAACSIRKGEK